MHRYEIYPLYETFMNNSPSKSFRPAPLFTGLVPVSEVFHFHKTFSSWSSLPGSYHAALRGYREGSGGKKYQVCSILSADCSILKYSTTRGEYLVPTAKVSRANELAYDDALASELWEFSVKMIKEATGEDIDYKADI